MLFKQEKNFRRVWKRGVFWQGVDRTPKLVRKISAISILNVHQLFKKPIKVDEDEIKVLT